MKKNGKARRVLFGTRKRVVISVIAVIALIGASVAVAAWIAASGSGNAQAKIGTATAVTLTVTADPTIGQGTGAPVTPGSPGALGFKVSNPQAQALTITNATAGTPVVSSGGTCADNAAALATHVTVTMTGFVGMTISANANQQSLAKNDAISLDASTPVCLSGATLNVPVTITAS